ncbi:quinone-dependent dihydroorotate dehydrogenase [Pleionea sediminis]|uniref:quinone-dependent dihydroorotate dehydrogenase n=1 Tax=Pleionea sediminis TaxID=2569479 RepID=UPI00118675BF|nr:quinone-dependent dihydroorotate dehydrogenase [Pleionea sediminis]
MHFLYPVIRKLLFSMEPEKSHDWSLGFMKKLEDSPFRFLLNQTRVDDPCELWGLTFPNRVGLAAGLDKDAAYIDALGALGFGFIEVGTVTPKPQPGNPKPRLFRLEKSEAIINRMGFNNLGVDNLVENVKRSNFDGVLGINLGKNKDTPEERAAEDYIIGMEKVFPHSDYITINISSPNTPGLRDMQFGEVLNELLRSIKQKQSELQNKYTKQVPVLVKIAPDLSDAEIEQVSDSFLTHKIDGIIATNTTVSRDAIAGEPLAKEAGGLSGRPLEAFSTEVLSKMNQALSGRIPLIGVGGIYDKETAIGKFAAGASLVQLYSGFIFKGPRLIEDVAKAAQIHFKRR